MASNVSPTPDPAPTSIDVPPPAPARSTRAPACIDSAALFAGAVEVQIDHRGTLYRLRQTALGKLILTK
jgi:hemin uptake protein HemP